MTDHNDTGATARPWSYEIQYGPNGEEIYAWVHYHNLMVCTVKVHHARMIVEAGNAYEPLKARLAEIERERDEALKLRDIWFDTHTSHQVAVQSVAKANGKLLRRAIEYRDGQEAAEARIVVLEEVLERADYYIERLERVQQRKRVRDMCEAMEGYRIARTALAAEQKEAWK